MSQHIHFGSQGTLTLNDRFFRLIHFELYACLYNLLIIYNEDLESFDKISLVYVLEIEIKVICYYEVLDVDRFSNFICLHDNYDKAT